MANFNVDSTKSLNLARGTVYKIHGTEKLTNTMNSNGEKKAYLREDKIKKKIFLILNKFLIIFSMYLSFLIPKNAEVYREVFSFSL